MPVESALCHAGDAGFHLIETFRHEPPSVFVRLERHLARLENSARQLGFRFDSMRIDEALASVTSTDRVLRVRLSLESDGKVSCVASEFENGRNSRKWRIAIAKTMIDPANPLLVHKTSQRDVYEAARAEFSPNQADEVILFNSRGELCEGTITNVFLDMGDDGPLQTPRRAAGLLPGILRAELLESGRAVESDLNAADFFRASNILVGNSLRGLIGTELVDPSIPKSRVQE